MKENSLRLEITYKQRGQIATANINESTFLFLDNAEAVEEYRKADFIKALKKSVKLFKNEKIYDLDLILYNSPNFYNEKRLYLIHQDYNNRENDTFTIYDYTERNTTKTAIVSNKIVIKTLEAAINEAIEKTFQELSA